MSLTEGKNREVRRVLAHLGLQVSRLIRTAYGPFTLAGLEPGDVDEVDAAELDAVPQDAEMRIIAGEWRGRPLEAPPGDGHPARPPTASAKPCSRCSPAGSAASRICASPTCSRAAARSASRPCRAARHRRPSSKTIAAAAAIIRRNADKLGATDRVARPRRLGAGAASIRPVRPDLRRPALCGGLRHVRPSRPSPRPAGSRPAAG